MNMSMRPHLLARLKAAAATTGERALLGMRVLVVGDGDINLEAIRGILEREGAQVVLAGSGQEAFERIRSEPRCIDVVLMDGQLPVLDGHGATRRIRHELNLPDLPIIALSADTSSDERQRATLAGTDDYIFTPFDPETLVNSILRLVRPAGRQLTGHPSATTETSARESIPWPVIEGIDSTDAHERLSGDFNLFQSMLKRLINEFSEVAIPAGAADPGALAIHAGRMHKLRGSAGMLGAKAIQQLAGEAEHACAAGEAARAAQLAAQLASLLKALNENTAPIVTATHIQDPQPQLSNDQFSRLDLADLIKLLRRQSWSAMNRFSDISPQLRRFLGKDAYERVAAHIGNLRFEQAAQVLEANPPGSR